MEISILIILYVITAGLFAFVGEEKIVKRMSLFLKCCVFTPIYGLIRILVKKKKLEKFEIETRYYCKRCGFEFSNPQENCPLCSEEGFQIKLKNVNYKERIYY